MRPTTKMFEIVCCECGATDKVSFEPRPGSALKCRKCFGKGGRRAKVEEKGRPGAEKKPELWKISCAICGAHDMVPFEPREGSEIKCRECFSTKRDEKARRQRYFEKGRAGRKSSHSVHIPRLDHGTRVSYPIECEACGKRETLDYVPKTSGPIKCRACTEEKFGSNWSQVKDAAQKEKKLAKERKESLRDGGDERNPQRLEEFEAHDEFVKVRKS